MSQNRERKRKFDIPIWCKANLSIEEAAAYSGIGMAKLYEMTESEDCPFVLWIGTAIGERSHKRIAERTDYFWL